MSMRLKFLKWVNRFNVWIHYFKVKRDISQTCHNNITEKMLRINTKCNNYL